MIYSSQVKRTSSFRPIGHWRVYLLNADELETMQSTISSIRPIGHWRVYLLIADKVQSNTKLSIDIINTMCYTLTKSRDKRLNSKWIHRTHDVISYGGLVPMIVLVRVTTY